jgi:hypothetical protein
MGGDALVHVGLPLLRDRALERDGDACAEVLKRARVGFRLVGKGREGGGADRGEARRADLERKLCALAPRAPVASMPSGMTRESGILFEVFCDIVTLRLLRRRRHLARDWTGCLWARRS